MRCENCGNESPEGSKFCIKCGKEFKAPEPAACPHCGAEIAPGTLFCPSCGKSIAAPEGSVGGGFTAGSTGGTGGGFTGETAGGTGGGSSYEPLPPLADPQGASFTSSIAMDIVLSFITCGI